MAYESIDKLQKVLADEVFKHTKDPKKLLEEHWVH